MSSRCNSGDLRFLFKMSLEMRLKSSTLRSLSWFVKNSVGASISTDLGEVIACRDIFLELTELFMRWMKVKRKKKG
jgi:hypothetical protein